MCMPICVQAICLFTPGKTLPIFPISLGLCVLNNGTDHYPQHNTLEVSLCLWIVLLKDSTDARVGANDGISVFYAIPTEGLHDLSGAVGEDVKVFIRFFGRCELKGLCGWFAALCGCEQVQYLC